MVAVAVVRHSSTVSLSLPVKWILTSNESNAPHANVEQLQRLCTESDCCTPPLLEHWSDLVLLIGELRRLGERFEPLPITLMLGHWIPR
jgi:hypothetical protein